MTSVVLNTYLGNFIEEINPHRIMQANIDVSGIINGLSDFVKDIEKLVNRSDCEAISELLSRNTVEMLIKDVKEKRENAVAPEQPKKVDAKFSKNALTNHIEVTKHQTELAEWNNQKSLLEKIKLDSRDLDENLREINVQARKVVNLHDDISKASTL